MLYDARKAARDWSGVIEDVVFCLTAFFDKDESQAKGRLQTHQAFPHLLSTWSKFKRDIHSASPVPTELLVFSLLFKMSPKHLISLFRIQVLLICLQAMESFLGETWHGISFMKNSTP